MMCWVMISQRNSWPLSEKEKIATYLVLWFLLHIAVAAKLLLTVNGTSIDALDGRSEPVREISVRLVEKKQMTCFVRVFLLYQSLIWRLLLDYQLLGLKLRLR